jgi:hypothetical protein
MARFQDIVTDQNNAPIAGAFVTVRNYPAGTLAAITDDNGLTLPNPLTADSGGSYYFNAPSALYTLEFRLLLNEVVRKVREVDLSDTLRADLAASGGSSLVNMTGTTIGTTGTPTNGTINRITSVTEAASGDVVYWGRSFAGARSAGAGASNLGWGPSGYMFDVRYDIADCGTDYSRGLYGRVVYGGSASKGGRIAILGEAYQQLGITSAANTIRDYIGISGHSITDSGDGGTDTNTGSLGAYFGMNGLVQINATATNIFEATGIELNTYVKTGASVKYLFGASIAGFNEVRGATADAALEIGGGTDAGFGPHVGWKTGILFSDIHGSVPVTSTSTLLGSYWTAGGTKALLNGIDLSGFAISGSVIQGAAMSLSESTLSLGVDGSGNSVIQSGSGATNAPMVIRPKGTSGAMIADGAGVNRVQVDSGIGIRWVPKTTGATPQNNGEVTIEFTSNTTLTFRAKGTDGTVRSATVTLA